MIVQVAEFMRAHVVTLPDVASLHDAVNVFDLYQVPAAVVVDASGSYRGLICRDDVLTFLKGAIGDGPENKADAAIRRALLEVAGRPVTEALRSKVPTLSPGSGIAEATGRVAAASCGIVPVLDGEQVVGTVGVADLAQALVLWALEQGPQEGGTA